MNEFYTTLTSPGFQKALYSLSVVSVVLAVGITLVAFSFYGRGREAEGVDPSERKWVLLFATWRDSLIITLLYTAESFMYRYMDFSTSAQISSFEPSLFAPTVVPIVVFVLEVLIFVVASLRIIAISRWLHGNLQTAG